MNEEVNMALMSLILQQTILEALTDILSGKTPTPESVWANYLVKLEGSDLKHDESFYKSLNELRVVYFGLVDQALQKVDNNIFADIPVESLPIN